MMTEDIVLGENENKMTNLKTETIEFLGMFGKTPDDIVWVGCPQYKIPTERFWELADVEYDDSYGAAEVAVDLIVVGADFWLERHEYDGSEWWEYKTLPKEPKEMRDVETVVRDFYWCLTDSKEEE